jgi:hypothetical protein
MIDPSTMKCPACGDFRWIPGVLQENHRVAFRPKARKFFALKLHLPYVTAYACGGCGCVQLAVDPDEVREHLKE